VVKELLWAANAGIPIIPLFDADLYKWANQLDKWNNIYPVRCCHCQQYRMAVVAVT
jgi:hypothetical protein